MEESFKAGKGKNSYVQHDNQLEFRLSCQSWWELQQVTASVQISTQQKNDSLIEENPIWAKPVEPLTLETVTANCNFMCVKAAMVSPHYLYCSVQTSMMYICDPMIVPQSYRYIYLHMVRKVTCN